GTNPAPVPIRTCCGWCFAHSRAPGPRLCPQDQSQRVGLARRVGNSVLLTIPTCRGWRFAYSRAPSQPQHAELVSESRAAPSPISWVEHQLRFGWIALDVAHGLSLVLRVAHVSVPIILFPEAAAPLQQLIHVLCRVLLPA